MQARVYFFYKKVEFLRKKHFFQLSTFNFQLFIVPLCSNWRIMGFLVKNRIRNFDFLIFNLVLITCVACNHVSTPKPYGYYRITVPDTSSTPFEANYPNYPYSFALSSNAVVQPRTDEPYWINVYYPALDATIHCSYKAVHHNLRELTNDALEFVYRNASFANSIPEREYAHPEVQVYGVLFDLEGNTASSCQFFVTDSTHHFFRASVYCNCPPNSDSLAPVYNYLRTDVIKMVESFEWKK